MRTPEQAQWDFVQDWLRKAGNDLRAARLLIEQQFNDYEATAFHAQQGAEKAMKAYLVRHQIEFPKTHDIERLRRIIADRDVQLAQELSEADALTPYAVEFRYPGELLVVSHESAQTALNIAERVDERVRQELKDYLDAGRPES